MPYIETPPDFLICLPSPFGIAPGTYWLSVQARQDSNPSGQWFWHNRTVQSRAGAVWQNPSDGYGTGCITWNRKSTCMDDQVWPDQVFQILGFREGPTPSPKPQRTPRFRPTPASSVIAVLDGNYSGELLSLLLLRGLVFDVFDDVADR